MDLKTNFHTHTYRCKHASGTESDYAKAAVKQGLSILGISDHAPFPDKDYGLRMDFSELPDYLSKIDEAQKIVGNQIRLLKALEIEYHPKYLSYYRELKEKYQIDYLILGEHTFTCENQEFKNVAFLKSTEEFLEYAQALCEGMETHLFDIVAHPDIIFKSNFAWDRNSEKACELIFQCAEKHHIPLEYNANGLRRGLQKFPDGIRYPYPHEAFWKRIKGSDLPVIIGSDAHIPEQIRDSAVLLAEEITANYHLNIIKEF